MDPAVKAAGIRACCGFTRLYNIAIDCHPPTPYDQDNFLQERIMKKIFLGQCLILQFLLLLPFTTHANIRDGLYIGAGIGQSFDQNDLTTTNFTNGITLNSEANEGNTIGTLFLGIGYTGSNAFFLGAELGTNFPGRTVNMPGISSITFSPLTISNRLTISDYVTLDILPGYAINNSLLVYARAGISYGELTFKQVLNNTAFSIRNSDSTLGGRIGIGTNFAFSNNFGIGLDYYYSGYQEMTVPASLFNMQFKSKPHSNFVGVSLLYNFNV
jgi:outer membrane immunogenic protein